MSLKKVLHILLNSRLGYGLEKSQIGITNLVVLFGSSPIPTPRNDARSVQKLTFNILNLKSWYPLVTTK